MKVLVSVHGHDYVTEHADPDDDWDRDNTRFEVDSVSAILVDDDQTAYEFYGRNPVSLDVEEGDLVYAVIVRYSTGDTFGNDDGRAAVMDVFKLEDEAHKFKDWLDKYDGPEYSGYRAKRSVPYNAEYNGVEYNIPWSGYFEHHESTDVYELLVEGNVARGRL